MKYLLAICMVLVMCEGVWGGEPDWNVTFNMQDIIWRLEDSEGHVHLFKPVVVEDRVCVDGMEIVVTTIPPTEDFICFEYGKSDYRLEWQHVGVEE